VGGLRVRERARVAAGVFRETNSPDPTPSLAASRDPRPCGRIEFPDKRWLELPAHREAGRRLARLRGERDEDVAANHGTAQSQADE
jgi:hypothetical protein